MRVIKYKAGPTARAFHNSDKVVRGFMGPVGNGKSVACINEMLRLAMLQWPNANGVRKSRWAVIRNTNPELRTTTLNTWKQWIPEEIAPVVMHPLITTKLIQEIKNDGTSIEMEVIFLALDKPDDVKKLLSLELTGIFINETREIPYAVVKGARERIGRYPAVIDGYKDVYKDGELIYDAPKLLDENGNVQIEDGEPLYAPCRRKALLMDTNPPDTDHWWYQLAEEGCLKGSKNVELAQQQTSEIFEFFRGPAPLLDKGNGVYVPNPVAENIKFLPGGFQYYLDMIAGNNEDHINVQVLGNYGAIKDGLPVFPLYHDSIHLMSGDRDLMPIKGLDICLGWDFGLTPACIIGQMTDTGQVRIIKELVSENLDVRRFARDVVKPFLSNKLNDFRIGFSLADPAGNNRGEGEGKASIGILNDDYIDNDDGDIVQPLNMGFETEPAPTNDPTKRLDAVNIFLSKVIEGGEHGFVLAKRCQTLRKGFNGGYKYKRIAVGGSSEKYKDKPDKDKYSHPHDALQYLCLGFASGASQDSGYDEDYDEYESTGTGY